MAAKRQTTEAPVFNALAQGEGPAEAAAFETAAKLAPADPAFRQNLESAQPRQ